MHLPYPLFFRARAMMTIPVLILRTRSSSRGQNLGSEKCEISEGGPPRFKRKCHVNNHVRITHATSPGGLGSVAAWEAQRRIYLATPTADLASGLVQPWVGVFVTRFHYSGCDTYNRGCYDPQGIPQLSPTRKERNVRVPTPAGATYWCTKHQHACVGRASVDPYRVPSLVLTES